MKHECQRHEAEWASKNELLVLKEYTEGHERSDFEHGYSILKHIPSRYWQPSLWRNLNHQYVQCLTQRIQIVIRHIRGNNERNYISVQTKLPMGTTDIQGCPIKLPIGPNQTTNCIYNSRHCEHYNHVTHVYVFLCTTVYQVNLLFCEHVTTWTQSGCNTEAVLQVDQVNNNNNNNNNN